MWGIILEPAKSYPIILKNAVHISRAALDLKRFKTGNDTVSVFAKMKGSQDLIICHLSKSKPQVLLDLIIKPDENITFRTMGLSSQGATIHLTGYAIDEENESEGVQEEEPGQNKIAEQNTRNVKEQVIPIKNTVNGKLNGSVVLEELKKHESRKSLQNTMKENNPKRKIEQTPDVTKKKPKLNDDSKANMNKDLFADNEKSDKQGFSNSDEYDEEGEDSDEEDEDNDVEKEEMVEKNQNRSKVFENKTSQKVGATKKFANRDNRQQKNKLSIDAKMFKGTPKIIKPVTIITPLKKTNQSINKPHQDTPKPSLQKKDVLPPRKRTTLKSSVIIEI